MPDTPKWWEEQVEKVKRDYENAAPWLRALMDRVYKEVTTHDD